MADRSLQIGFRPPQAQLRDPAVRTADATPRRVTDARPETVAADGRDVARAQTPDNAVPTTTLGGVTPPQDTRTPYAKAVDRARTWNGAYREQSSLVLGALLHQPLADLNPLDWGTGRILRDDAMHATLRLNTSMWTVVRDIRAGRVQPQAFGKTSWDAVGPQDMYNLGVQRLRSGDEDWAAATTAMIADRETPPLHILDPQTGATDLVPANISWWNRSVEGLVAPDNAALILEHMAVGQAIRNGAVRVGGATPDQRSAARASAYMETATTLSNGSQGRIARGGNPQRPLPENDAMTAEALMRGTDTFYRLEPMPANATEASLRASLARHEFVGMVPKTDNAGNVSWFLAKPFRNEADIAREVMRKLSGGELDNLDQTTQSRLRALCGPANNIGAQLTTRLTQQNKEQTNRMRVSSLAEMAAIGVIAASGGAVIGIAARALGASTAVATTAGVIGQGVVFTGAAQISSGHFDPWQFPQDFALSVATAGFGRYAQGLRLWSEAGLVARGAASATRAGLAIGAGAFIGTSVAATREVIQTGKVPDATRVRDQFMDAVIAGTVLHGVNTTLSRYAPQLTPESSAYREYRGINARARDAQSEGQRYLTQLDELATQGAALQARGLPASDPSRVANVEQQIAVMKQFTGVGRRVEAIRNEADAFGAKYLSAAAVTAAQRRDSRTTSTTPANDQVGSLMRGDVDAATTMRLSSMDATTRQSLQPGGAVFADAVRRGGGSLSAVLTLNRVSGTKPEDIMTGIAKAYADVPGTRPRYSDIAEQVIQHGGITAGWPAEALGSAQVRVEQIFQRMINFHDQSQWRSVAHELLLDAATPLPTGADAIPIADGMSRIATIRQQRSIAATKNIGFANFDLETNGVRTSGELEAISGQPKRYPTRPGSVELINQTSSRRLGPEAENNPRAHDTEWAILENVAGRITPETRGTVRLFSERPCCPSCQLIISRFHRMYPNINLVVSTGPAT